MQEHTHVHTMGRMQGMDEGRGQCRSCNQRQVGGAAAEEEVMFSRCWAKAALQADEAALSSVILE